MYDEMSLMELFSSILKVWTTGGPELHLIQEIHEHTKPVTGLTVLHSSEKLYSGSLDRTVRV